MFTGCFKLKNYRACYKLLQLFMKYVEHNFVFRKITQAGVKGYATEKMAIVIIARKSEKSSVLQIETELRIAFKVCLTVVFRQILFHLKPCPRSSFQYSEVIGKLRLFS